MHSLPVKEYQIIDQLLPELKDEAAKTIDLFKSKPELVKEPMKAVLVTPTVTLVWVSRPPRKLFLLLRLPSSLLSWLSFLLEEVTGVLIWVLSLPTKVTGCGSVLVRLIPAQEVRALLLSYVRKLIQLAGVEDVYIYLMVLPEPPRTP